MILVNISGLAFEDTFPDKSSLGVGLRSGYNPWMDRIMSRGLAVSKQLHLT